ncbi:class I SAM-dependent methyltransferase [Candidatus Aerophobetes bacterium]|nr:class I SAM-dependent methyltransferase [Candidatus Aerophobetes bacterium]
MSWQVFDKLYLRYDEWFDTFPGREIFELELECLKNSLKEVPKPWLEVGIGTGRFAKALGVDFGVDPSIEMLKVALKRNLKVTKATAEHLPFGERSFGGVIMVVTLCFLDNSLEALRESFGILRKGGILVLGIVPGKSEWGKFYLKKKREGHPFYSVAHFYTIKESIEIAEKAGFKLEGVFSTLFEGPEDITHIKSYPPKPELKEEAGFACIKMRKP